jgi:hypothetical protein
MGLLEKLRLKRSNNKVGLQDVQTVAQSGVKGHDFDRNGVPDYLQRPDLPSIVKSNKDFSQWDTDITPEIEEWIMYLRGYERKEDGVSYHSTSPPILNEVGITGIKTFLIPICNKHGINTALKVDEVHEFTYYNATKFARWLKHNYKRIGLSLSYLTPLVLQLEEFTIIPLSRSIDDGQRKHTSERIKITGNMGQQPQQFP